MKTTDHQLSNQQWALVFDLFSELVDGAKMEKVVAAQPDEAVRLALENLWQQHKRAEKTHFLEEQITVVSELSVPGPVVFHPGQLLAGRFAILRLLGQGGMGEVYLADDRRLMETIALKTIKRELARDKENSDRFLSEVQNSRRVTHPNVCRIFDLFEHDGVPFYSMEYVAGPTLAEVLAAAVLNPERAKSLAIQTAEGLWTAHKNGILHCDFKPANIILAGSGKNERAVITDFGLARAFGRGDSLSHHGSPAGTPSYMAPELLKGHAPSLRTDIYAFGKVLEALLPGNRLAAECAATEATDRPESLEPVIRELRGSNSTRRNWISGLLLGATGSAVYLYDRSRPKIPLGSKQRVRVNGFTPESADNAKVVRNLLVMALRQSPLLSVVGDRPYQLLDGGPVVSAGFALPLVNLLATARAENANLAIDGKLESSGNGLRLSVNVYDPTASTPRYTKHVEVDDRRHLVKLAELAAKDLRSSAFGESELHATYTPLEQVTSASPEAVDCYFRAVFHYENSEATPALVLLDQAIAIDPNFVLAHHYRALVLGALEMMESAEASEELAFAKRLRVTERERNWIDWSYYNITKNWINSVAAVQRNTVLFPDEAIFQRGIAFSLMRLGRYEEALPHNRLAVELDPFSRNNTHELVMNLAESNQVDECFKEVAKLEATSRTPSLIHSELAMAYLQKGDYERSLSECRLFGASSAERVSWSALLALPALVMSGRFTEAIQSIQGDLALNSARPSGEKEETKDYTRRSFLGQLHRLKDEAGLAAEQAEFLLQLRPLACNLILLREGCALALDLNEIALAERGLESLRKVAARWPSSHSQGALSMTQAMLKDAQGDSDSGALFANAIASWPDPINLYYVSRWQGKSGLPQAQLASLTELERMRGKVYKFHFAGLVVLGWLEQARCLRSMSRFGEALRMYERVVEHWSNPQTAGSLMRQARSEADALRKRLG